MPNITYLVGAGASAEIIPCVADFTEKLSSSIDYYRAEKNNVLDFLNKNPDKSFPKNIEKEYDDFFNSLESILSEAKKYSTIDTYAKYLYITNRYESIGLLSLLLSIGLLFFQKEGVDKRYDDFWSSVLEDTPIPPANMKILSWNYDLQFEQSYLKFSKQKSISNCQAFLRVFPSNSKSYLADYKDDNQFALVKLNGGIVKYDSQAGRFQTLIDDCFEFYIGIKNIITQYFNWLPESNNGKRAIHIGYAWDTIRRDPKNTSVIIGKEMAKSSDTLIIIGYSFPFFNRKVDREIIGSMSNLRNIYVQDLYPERIISRLKSIIPEKMNFSISISPLKDTKQFFIPYEF